MDVKHINPFLASVENVLGQFGVSDISRGSLNMKEDMIIDQEVTAFVGIVGQIRGNISYSCSIETAKNIASAMMMGMLVLELDEMSRSAIAEMSNMFAGTAGASLGADKVLIDITPPSVIVGEDMYFVLSFVPALSVTMQTSAGILEINIGLEN